MRPPPVSRTGERTLLSSGFAGRVSIGLIHATPGDMKSFRSSAERMALIVGDAGRGRGGNQENVQKRRRRNARKEVVNAQQTCEDRQTVPPPQKSEPP
jgi:hypothetical protein